MLTLTFLPLPLQYTTTDDLDYSQFYAYSEVEGETETVPTDEYEAGSDPQVNKTLKKDACFVPWCLTVPFVPSLPFPTFCGLPFTVCLDMSIKLVSLL